MQGLNLLIPWGARDGERGKKEKYSPERAEGGGANYEEKSL